LSTQPNNPPQGIDGTPLPQPGLWRKLLSGNREQIADAAAQINAAGLTDEYATLLLAARRRRARFTRRLFGIVPLRIPYTERERRSALTALGVLWGALGRELGMALDPKASHFDREHAHKSLARRRDQRAVRPLIDALLAGHALEDWQCIPTLGALGDARAADALAQYIGLNTDTACIPDSAVLDIAPDVGRALRSLNAHHMLKVAQQALYSALPHQRAGAALVIAGWDDENLAPSLVPLVEDHVPMVRIAAISALGELKAAASLIPLQAIIADPDPDVRLAAERALQQVTTASAQRAVKSKNKHPNPAKR
jgi:HEAT repeat protein